MYTTHKKAIKCSYLKTGKNKYKFGNCLVVSVDYPFISIMCHIVGLVSTGESEVCCNWIQPIQLCQKLTEIECSLFIDKCTIVLKVERNHFSVFK